MIIASPNSPVRREVALTADQVRWFLGGRDFLDAVARLSEVQCVAHCRRCLAAGGSGAVTATRDPVHPRTFVMCACRSGQVSRKAPLDLTQLLDTLGWTIDCPHCHQGVWGDNAWTETSVTITCGCTTRRFSLPVAATDPPAPGVSPLASVGR